MAKNARSDETVFFRARLRVSDGLRYPSGRGTGKTHANSVQHDPLARISHQVSSREFVRAALARRDGRFDRKRVSYTLRIEPFVATQSSDAFTDSQQEAGEKCGLESE